MIMSLWGDIRRIQSEINTLDGQLTTIGSGGGGGGTVTASNGLTASSSNVVLGQAVGAVGDPAAFSSIREIPVATFTLNLKDSSGNFSNFGAGTFLINRIGSGSVTITTSKTTNVGITCLFATSTTTFNGGFNSDTTGGTPLAGTRRYATISTGVTITPNTSNRMGCIQGTLGFENDVPGTNNPITIAGSQAASVYSAKIDFWPVNGGQVKTITGTIAAYNIFLDASSVVNTTVQTIVDYQSSSLAGNGASPINITNRYGFRCIDMGTGSQVTTNRWAFASEGATDMNWFNGFSGFGVSQPTHRVHIAAGTATVAPIVMTPGVVLTTPVNGALETDGTNLYFTVGGVRKTVTLT